MSHSWKNILVKLDSSLRDVLSILDKTSLRVVIVISDDQELLGVITDGDVRRALLRGKGLDSIAKEIMNINPITASPSISKKELIKLMEVKDILSIPLVENNIVVGLETLHHMLEQPRYDNPVYLVAGGLGTRLRPLTDVNPKPMLSVGEKPILETLLNQFIDAGFYNFFISTHYMPEKILNHFGDGSRWGVKIEYLHEEVPLGTGGALGLLPKNIPDLPLIMMNGDVLTKVDFQQLLSFHCKSNGAATMCVREYEYQVPYGVIKGKANKVVSMEEKPIQRFFVNAGIYVLNPEIYKAVPRNSNIDMPNLLEKFMHKNIDIIMFPIHEYWLDIGRMDDFERAQADIINLGIK
ncbi:MAG: nucleotidyltransferase family protein [Cellvibrionaceae bacterium]